MSIPGRFGFCAAALAALLPATAFATQPGWYVAIDGGQAQYSGIAGDALEWVSMPPRPAPGWMVDGAYASVNQHDPGHIAYRLTAGYQFNSYFGVEAGYVELGNVHATGNGDYSWRCYNPTPGDMCVMIVGGGPYTSTARLRAHGWVVAATGSWPITPRWSLFTRLGVFDAHTAFDATSTPSTSDSQVVPAMTRFSSIDWKPTYGLGVSYSPIDHWALRLGWDHYASLGDRSITGKFGVSLISVGVVYTL